MIVRTHAIPLTFTPVTESSRAVTWMTEDHGRLVTLIKGSQRPKSLFLGQYDLFYTCELLFYNRDRDGWLIARECNTLSARDRFRTDWRACLAASYLCDLVRTCVPHRTPAPELFQLLHRALEDLNARGADLIHLLWFELALLQKLGLTPQFTACIECGTSMINQPGAHWVGARGGMVCRSCHQRSQEHGIPLPPDVVAALSHWQRATQPPPVSKIRMEETRQQTAAKALGIFLRMHLDSPLVSRRIAMRALLYRKKA